MKKDTRQRILDAAQNLFNQYGYNGVSLHDIAEEIGISKGNLTYHFAKKEEIIESLLAGEIDTFPKEPPATLRELDNLFDDMQKTVQSHSYFFLHHAQLAQISQEVLKKQKDRYGNVSAILKESFDILCSKGLFRREIFHGEYQHLIDMVHMSAIYWAPFEKIRSSSDVYIDFRYHVWGLLYNLLTEKGRRVLRDSEIIYHNANE